MKLTTVLGSVNSNPNYYMFIPKQILFWKKFGIKFIPVLVSDKIPDELLDYKDEIILWNKNLTLNTAFVAQNLRMYYTALLKLKDNEMVMITDMDMLPGCPDYYISGLEGFKKDDFIYYRHIDGNQIYMCYNAAHPDTWSKVFGINNESDIEKIIQESYVSSYDGIPGSTGWYSDQLIMYEKLINYPGLKVLNRGIRRLEVYMYNDFLCKGLTNFIKDYDDMHFHRSYPNNITLIENAENQLNDIYNNYVNIINNVESESVPVESQTNILELEDNKFNKLLEERNEEYKKLINKKEKTLKKLYNIMKELENLEIKKEKEIKKIYKILKEIENFDNTQ